MRRLFAASALAAVSAALIAAPAGATTRSPTTLTFPSQAVGTTSAAQAIAIDNGCAFTNPIGGGCLFPDVFVTQPTFTGANIGDFVQTNTCSLGGGSTDCAFSVRFKPTAAGTRTATLTLGFNLAGSSPGSVTLSGTAVAPANSGNGAGTTGAPTKGKCKKKAKKGATAAKKCKRKKK